MVTETAREADQRLEIEELRIGSGDGRSATGRYGMLCLIVTEGFLFAYLLFSYAYFAIEEGSASWLPRELPSFSLSGPNTMILVASSVVLWFGERHLRRHDGSGTAALVILAGMALGVLFVGIQLAEWHSKSFGLDSGSYGSLYFTTTGFHMAHVVVGLLILAAVALWTGLGYFGRGHMEPVSIGILYWHFVDAIWLTVFFTFYVTPRLG